MNIYTLLLVFLMVFGVGAVILRNTSPSSLAKFTRLIPTILAGILGGVFLFTGKAVLAMPMFALAGWLYKTRYKFFASHTRTQSSTVRSKWLEMRLDHETGKLDGTVIHGTKQGTKLKDLNQKELLDLYADLSGDGESASLLEAYLDGRIPGWRERTDANFASGDGDSVGTGPMTDEEAYQILGLESGATREEIRTAHRRLVKAVHPDTGGSTYLTARINQAKDTLLK